MHELSIASSILESATEFVSQQAGKLESVKVAIGELSAVEPDLLSFAWDALIVETDTPAAQLEIEWRPARAYCSSCQKEVQRTEGSWLRFCSSCGEMVHTEGGNELDIIQISFLQEESYGE